MTIAFSPNLPEKTTIFRVVGNLSVGGKPFTSWGGGVTALGAMIADCLRDLLGCCDLSKRVCIVWCCVGPVQKRKRKRGEK